MVSLNMKFAVQPCDLVAFQRDDKATVVMRYPQGFSSFSESCENQIGVKLSPNELMDSDSNGGG